MTELYSKNNLSFMKDSKFRLHNKRSSLGAVYTEKEQTVAPTHTQRSEFLPYLYKNPAIVSKSSPIREEPSSDQPFINFPVTPNYVLNFYISHLTYYEQSEILDYSLIYFFGYPEKKLNSSSPDHNYGFDDDKGEYKVVVNDHLAYRYEVLEILGKGSFGQVCRCFDHKNKEYCAIKIIKNKRRFHKQAVIEVKILRYINSHDHEDLSNAIHLLENFSFRKHLCLKFERLHISLYELTKANNFTGFPIGLVRSFAVQIAKCLVFMKKHLIIHCDLKPENILLMSSKTSQLKVIDFGSACFSDERLYTYIQSRFYRAPEVILGLPYSTSIDTWSFGLILIELLLGYPLFAGEDEKEQLMIMIEYLGYPPRQMLEEAHRTAEFFNEEGEVMYIVNSRGKERSPGSRKLSEKVRCGDFKFIDLVEGKKYLACLCWEPKNRISPEDILCHPWVTGKSKKY